jgi:hypothetical protein
MTENEIKLLAEAIAPEFASFVDKAVEKKTQVLLDRIRKLEDRANDLENERRRKQR